MCQNQNLLPYPGSLYLNWSILCEIMKEKDKKNDNIKNMYEMLKIHAQSWVWKARRGHLGFYHFFKLSGAEFLPPTTSAS